MVLIKKRFPLNREKIEREPPQRRLNYLITSLLSAFETICKTFGLADSATSLTYHADGLKNMAATQTVVLKMTIYSVAARMILFHCFFSIFKVQHNH